MSIPEKRQIAGTTLYLLDGKPLQSGMQVEADLGGRWLPGTFEQSPLVNGAVLYVTTPAGLAPLVLPDGLHLRFQTSAPQEKHQMRAVYEALEGLLDVVGQEGEDGDYFELDALIIALRAVVSATNAPYHLKSQAIDQARARAEDVLRFVQPVWLRE